MKQMFAITFAFAIVSASALAAEAVSDEAVRVVGSEELISAQTDTTVRVVGSDTSGFLLLSEDDYKPDKKPDEKRDGTGGETQEGGGSGGTTPPDKPGEGGTGGSSEGSVFLTGAYSYTGGTNTLVGQTLASTTADQNVILAMTNAYVTVSNCVLNKSGDTSSEDNSNFYAVNAVVAAKTASTVCIAHSELNSYAEGANCLFASGSGSTIYAYDCTNTSTKGSSRGLDATYEGTVIAAKMTINTSGDHCAAFATDRGNGYISVTDATMATAGQGSPLIYSTGVIEVNGVTGTATGAQIAGIEGLSTIRIKNAKLTGSGEKASEPVANGVIIYQSNSGDYTEGTATFEVSDSTLSSAITNGALFYITHSEAVITVQDTDFEFDTDKNCLLKAAGNDGSNGWGDAGSNGAVVVFTAIDQTLAGNVSVDGISSLDMYLTNSTYTGTFVNDTTYTGSGDGIELFLSADSKWIVTAGCTLKSLTVADGATIVDGDGNTVSIINTSGTKHVTGTGTLTITVSSYTSGDVVITNAITAFEIDRTAFGAMYGTTESEEGAGTDEGEEEGGGSSGGGATDHDGWVYYCKPHPPDNAIVKVLVEGAKDYGTPDRDHKYCLDGYWDGNAATGVVVHLLYVTTEGYLFADGCTSNKWDVTVTNNEQEIYPPEDVVAIRTQAKSGRTYYLTLKEAIEKSGGGGKGGAKISLNDSFTLSETLTITNTLTLDLNTNTVTLADKLTEAFHIASTATISNGTINGDGCLLYVDDGAKVTLTNGCVFTCHSAASIYCSSNGTLTIAGDTYKDDGVVLAAPDGYYWENGHLVEGTLSETITAGTTTNSYDNAQSATNAAAVINANKAESITVPEGIEGTAKATYLTKIEATVTADNCVVIDLTSEAKEEEQTVLDEAVTNEIAVAALVSTNASAKATLATTTPGLYYWIQGGTEADAVTTSGAGVLSKTGGAVELTKPALDATKGKAFFKIAAGVAAPASPAL